MSDFEPITENDFSSHYDDPYHRGACECVTHAAEMVFQLPTPKSSPETGSRADSSQTGPDACGIRFELAIDESRQVAEAWWDGQGCKWCEGFASLLCERLENLAEPDALTSTSHLLTSAKAAVADRNEPTSGEASLDRKADCLAATADAFRQAWKSPVQDLEDDLADGSQFGGPSLREEC